MAVGDKILNFMYKDSSPTFIKKYDYEELSKSCEIEKENILPMLRHLENLGRISAKNKRGCVGQLDIKHKEICLSTAGVDYIDQKNSIPRKIKTWAPVIISIGALIISIIALLNDLNS